MVCLVAQSEHHTQSVAWGAMTQSDYILHNANIYTMENSRPRAEWLAVAHGRIVAIGDRDDYPTGQKMVDAEGATVTPGFNDAHCHTAWFGLSRAEVDCKAHSTLDSLYDALVERASALEPGMWVLASGYNQEAFGGHYPDIAELDRRLPHHPLFMRHTSGHACIVNTRAIDISGVLGEAGDVDGGAVVLDDQGNPTGLLEERAQALIQRMLLPKSQAELEQALGRASRAYLSEGITSFTEAGVAAGWIGHSPAEIAAYQSAQDKGLLHQRAQLMVVSDLFHDVAGEPPSFGLDGGIRTGFGSEWLSVGPMKIFLDGSMLAWTGAMSEPFSAGPPNNYGYFQADEDALAQTMLSAAASGWAVAAHAIGDRAVSLALDTFAKAIGRSGQPVVPHRIEHGGVVTDAQVVQAAELGVAIVTQPGFMPELGVQMAEAMGAKRGGLIHRHRSLLDAGVLAAGSSDRPVANGRPLHIMQAMAERRAADGLVVGEGERVSIEQALWSYTVGSAQTTGMASIKGTLMPGMLADFVVLDRDPLNSPIDEIGDITVTHTAVGGTLFDTSALD